MQKIIYSLEDDESIGFIIKRILENNECTVRLFTNYRTFLDALRDTKPDMVLLDLMLGDFDGVEIIKYLRAKVEYRKLPVIVISAKIEEFDRVKCLDLGADDYISKPFSYLELNSRVNALFRRTRDENVIAIKDIIIDLNSYKCFKNGCPIELTNKEFDLLKMLVINHKKIVLRKDIESDIWPNISDDSRTIDMHINSLRKKLFYDDKEALRTIFKVGYILSYE